MCQPGQVVHGLHGGEQWCVMFPDLKTCDLIAFDMLEGGRHDLQSGALPVVACAALTVSLNMQPGTDRMVCFAGDMDRCRFYFDQVRACTTDFA